MSDGMSAAARPGTRRGPTVGQKGLSFLDDDARVRKRGMPCARLVAAAYRLTHRYLSGIGTPFETEDADQLTRGRAWTVEPNWRPRVTQFADVLLANGCSTATADRDDGRLAVSREALIAVHRGSLHSIFPCSQGSQGSQGSQDKRCCDARVGGVARAPEKQTKTTSAGDDSAGGQTIRWQRLSAPRRYASLIAEMCVVVRGVMCDDHLRSRSVRVNR